MPSPYRCGSMCFLEGHTSGTCCVNSPIAHRLPPTWLAGLAASPPPISQIAIAFRCAESQPDALGRGMQTKACNGDMLAFLHAGLGCGRCFTMSLPIWRLHWEDVRGAQGGRQDGDAVPPLHARPLRGPVQQGPRDRDQRQHRPPADGGHHGGQPCGCDLLVLDQVDGDPDGVRIGAWTSTRATPSSRSTSRSTGSPSSTPASPCCSSRASSPPSSCACSRTTSSSERRHTQLPRTVTLPHSDAVTVQQLAILLPLPPSCSSRGVPSSFTSRWPAARLPAWLAAQKRVCGLSVVVGGRYTARGRERGGAGGDRVEVHPRGRLPLPSVPNVQPRTQAHDPLTSPLLSRALPPLSAAVCCF